MFETIKKILLIGILLSTISLYSDLQKEFDLLAMADVQGEYDLLALQEPLALDKPETNNTDYDALFYEVFGYHQVKPYKLLVPFFINGNRVGKIEVFLKKGADQVHVRKNTLYRKLGQVINKPLLEWLVGATLNLSTVNLTFLEENNIFTDYDEQLLQFELSVPPEYIKANTSELGYSNVPSNIDYALSPSKYSGYLNLRAAQELNYSSYDVEIENIRPFAINFDGALNIHQVVLEGLGEYSRDDQWRRSMTRLVYDQPEYMFRYYLGDLSIPVLGYQTSPSMGGIAFTKDFNLQPYRTTQPESMNGVVILRPSIVEIYANEVLMEKREVDPGPFNLRQTSLNHGINNVKVVITNDIGDVETIDLNSYNNNLQLKKDLDQYSINIGVASQYFNGEIDYHTDEPITSMFYRRGITNRLTLASYSQIKFDQFMFGMGSNFGTVFGNFNIDVAMSATDSASVDCASRLSYSYFDNNYEENPFHRQWRGSVEYLGKNYANINELTPKNLVSYIITGSVSQNITETINGSFSTSYGWGREGQNDIHTYSLSLAKRISSGMRIACTISNREESDLYDSWRASLSFTYNPPINHLFNSVYDSKDQAGRVNWSYNSENGSIVNNLSTNHSERDPLDISNRTSYSGNRGSVTLDYRFNEDEDGYQSNVFNFTGNTGIVFVDGHFGWGKMINNSFAKIKPTKVIKDYKVGINKTR
ncbi:MAG: fimbria/pilus outer membrane usher protein, partial [Candidatus Delongbacteria bacterium]|nr:fimbria/pilus outer membrane usher protein [Candidatus Delongbacteria bacterium]